MAITVQALQADGTWAVRNAFVTENAKVISGAMKAADLEAQARRVMAQWQSYADGRQLRIHNSDNDPTPSQRKRSAANSQSETEARSLGWMTAKERHGVEDYGVVHPHGHWAADWTCAVILHSALEAASAKFRRSQAA